MATDTGTRARLTTWQEPHDLVYRMRLQLERGVPLTIEQGLKLTEIIGDQRAIIALQDER